MADVERETRVRERTGQDGLGEREARRLKADASDRLRRFDLSRLPLAETDTRLLAYVEGVRDNPEAHNLYEVLSVARFCDMMSRYAWRVKKVRKFIKLYEALKFSGIKGRRTYKLTPVQVFMFAALFGFYRDDGRRLTREAIWFVPRKFSKTTSAASLAVYELLYGDANAQAYTGANSYKQARICFDEISKITRQLDPGKKYFRSTREHIGWKQGNPYGKESFAECLTGGGDTKDGLNASLVIMDEYAQARYTKDHSVGAELLNVLRSSMGAREEPLTLIITTASRVPDGPFASELDGARAVLRGELEDDSLQAMLFAPDVWEEEDLGNPAVWMKCNPHIGVTVQTDYYAEFWKRAQRDPEQMTEFRTKLVNVFTQEGVRPWFTPSEARALSSGWRIEQTEGHPPAMAAIDLSVRDDFSVVSYVVYSRAARKFYVASDYFIPEETLTWHPNRRQYQRWVRDGWMTAVPGAVITAEPIVERIMARNKIVRILKIGYDAYKSMEVVNELGAAIASTGTRPERILTAYPQTYGSFTSPVETFERAAFMEPRGVVFDDNPIQPYCLVNAVIDEDRMRNRKPIKRKTNLKIDSVITTLMGFGLWNTVE